MLQALERMHARGVQDWLKKMVDSLRFEVEDLLVGNIGVCLLEAAKFLSGATVAERAHRTIEEMLRSLQ